MAEQTSFTPEVYDFAQKGSTKLFILSINGDTARCRHAEAIGVRATIDIAGLGQAISNVGGTRTWQYTGQIRWDR